MILVTFAKDTFYRHLRWQNARCDGYVARADLETTVVAPLYLEKKRLPDNTEEAFSLPPPRTALLHSEDLLHRPVRCLSNTNNNCLSRKSSAGGIVYSAVLFDHRVGWMREEMRDRHLLLIIVFISFSICAHVSRTSRRGSPDSAGDDDGMAVHV